MVNLNVNFNKKTDVIRPMHAIGQPPFTKSGDFKHFHYLKEANIPYSRLHDVGGDYGSNIFCDVPNIFRDFDADENDPASYDFAFTDILLKAMIENGCEPYYRLGVTIENFASVKAYRIYPPKDFAKWARICEHIIRHYNEGWADGFFYDIKYWEIWNEPDSLDWTKSQTWLGTKEQFFKFYAIASKHLKSCFGDKIKVGGYASCGFYGVMKFLKPNGTALGLPEDPDDWDKRCIYFIQFFNDFLKFAKENNLPLDFFSWHSYDPVDNLVKMQKFVRQRLDEEGFVHTESHLTPIIRWKDSARAMHVQKPLPCF